MAEQVGLHAAPAHFAFDKRRRKADADRDRFTLAQLIFEDAQCFVEGIDEEIGDAVAQRLLLREAIGRGNQRGRASDVGGYDERAARIVELAGIEEFSAEPDFAIGGFDEGGVGLRDTDCEEKCRVGWRFERQDSILLARPRMHGPRHWAIAEADRH